jgi:hypothetical protein
MRLICLLILAFLGTATLAEAAVRRVVIRQPARIAVGAVRAPFRATARIIQRVQIRRVQHYAAPIIVQRVSAYGYGASAYTAPLTSAYSAPLTSAQEVVEAPAVQRVILRQEVGGYGCHAGVAAFRVQRVRFFRH